MIWYKACRLEINTCLWSRKTWYKWTRRDDSSQVWKPLWMGSESNNMPAWWTRMNLILLLLTDYLCNTKKKKKKSGPYSFGKMWNNLKIDLWCDQTAKVCDKRSSPQDVTCCCIAATHHWWWWTNILIA